MKAISDLLAVALFFVVYIVTKNIFWATAAAIVIGIVQTAFLWFKHKKLETMQIVSVVLMVVLGGATLLFRDPNFIMWKPTVLFWVGALALVIGQLLGKQPVQAMMGKHFTLPERIWRHLLWLWVGFLFFLGVANLVAAKLLSEAGWVKYKSFGSSALIVIFMLGLIVYIKPYLPEDTFEKE